MSTAVTPPEFGVGQLGQVAGAHQQFGMRQRAAQFGVARQRGHEPEMDRVEDRIEQRCDAALVCGLGGTQQRRQVTMGCRNEHRRHRSASRDIERVLGQAQQKIRARANRASQFAHIGRIDADRKSRAGELSYRVLEMRKRRVGKAAEVDHIRARLAHRSGTGEDRIDLEFRCIDDFGEYANVVPRQIRLAAALAEISRQILQLVGAAVERHAELRRKAIEIGAAASGHEHTRSHSMDVADGAR